MVTAIEPNMFGLLRRLHIHSMETALNELSPQNSIIQSLNFSPHSLIFKGHPKSEEKRRDFICGSQKRSSSYVPISDSRATKRPRRLTRLSTDDTKESNKTTTTTTTGSSKSKSEHGSSSANFQEPVAPILSTCTYLLSPDPPALHTPRSPILRNSQTCFSDPPVLSNPVTPSSSFHHLDQLRLASNPPSMPPNLSQSSTPFPRVTLTDELLVSEIYDSVTPTPLCNKGPLRIAEDSNQSASCPARSRYPLRGLNPANPKTCLPSVAKTPEKLTTTTTTTTVVTPSFSRSKSWISPKRRRSIDHLTEPSIHGEPDLEITPRHRTRRPTQFLQIEAPSQPVRSLQSKSLYLETSSGYYFPNFSTPLTCSTSSCPVEDVSPPSDSSQAIIEVPNWRVMLPSDIANHLRNPPSVNQTDQAVGNKYSSGKTRHTTVDDSRQLYSMRSLRSVGHSTKGETSSTSRVRHRSGSSQSQKTKSKLSDPVKQDDLVEEDTSDAVYLNRHARFELEEVRRERILRQRTAEQELKIRLELRDQASWHKRQPGRLDPLLKFKPSERMPSSLNYPLNQICQFHVTDSIPVIAFGCRVPLASLKHFCSHNV